MRLPRDTVNYVLCATMFVVLGALLLYPIYLTTRGAFFTDPAAGKGFTLVNLRLLTEDPALFEGLMNSLRVAATTTLIATTLALPLAVLSVKYRYPLKGVFSALVLVPMILPPFVGALGFKLMWGREGAVNALLEIGRAHV